ncbi:MAG: hypothetical protein EXR07_06865 [Acetobacteraceae bacterium]|nr:hypothetical protein [Acetobacteraceae bacterium]
MPAAWLVAPAKAAGTIWNEVTGDAGYGLPVAGVQQGDALLSRREAGGGRALLRWPWGDTLGDNARPAFDETAAIATLPPNATDPMVPVRDGAFWKDPARWLLWREEAAIHAVDTSGRRQKLVLDAPPASLLRPALQREGGPVEVYILARDRLRVLRARLPRDGRAAARIEVATDLPLAAGAGCAGFARDGRPAVGLWAMAAEELTLLLFHDGHLHRAAIGGVRPLSPPAFLADSNGPLVGVVVQSASGIGLAETVFVPGRGITLTPLAPLRNGRKAALVYRPWGAGAPRAHVVLATEDGSFHSLSPGVAPSRLTPPAPPVRPLVLVPGGLGAFLLCCDPMTGPEMASV